MTVGLHDFSKVRKAQEVASYYGFHPITIPKVSRDDRKCAKPLKDCSLHPLDKYMDRKVSLLRHYIEEKLSDLPKPIMVSYRTTAPRSRSEELHLDIIGNNKSIAEALLIQAASAILKEEGHRGISVRLNSFGDKDSYENFESELNSFNRKNISDLNTKCQEAIKNNPLSIFSCPCEQCYELRQIAPKPINFLDEASRVHFKEVLEFIDNLDIPYEIDDSLIGNRHYGGETIFEIRNQKSEDSLAHGLRYNTLIKKMGYRRDMPAIGMTLAYNPRKRKKPTKKSIRNLGSRKFYFVHLGFEAKIKSLNVIEALRQAHIPIHHALNKSKCEGQMSLAKKCSPEYLIIMGIKEALENSVVVRNTETRSQHIVPIEELVPFISRIK